MSDATKVVTDTCMATKDRVTLASEHVLVSRPVQTYFDVLQFILNKAENTVDLVLPKPDTSAGEEVTGEDEEENERIRLSRSAAESLNRPPVAPADRGWELFGQFVSLVGTTKDRVQERTHQRIDGTLSLVQNTITRTRDTINVCIQLLLSLLGS
jgi:hypothetical protein